MDLKKVMAVVDKHVDQEALAKDMAKEFVMPFIKEKLMGIDLIPGTDIDQKILAEVVAFLEKQVA